MKQLFSVLALSAIVFTSCGTNEPQENSSANSTTATKIENTTPPDHTVYSGDTMTVNERIAVFNLADTGRIEKLKRQMGEDNFYTYADDAMFYTSAAFDYLDSMKLPNISTREYKYLRFAKDDGSSILVRLDTLPDPWTVYFFDPSKEPKMADLFDIQTSYTKYFK